MLVASSDLPEIVRLADRVLVLREGQLAGALEGDAITQLAIMHLAMGTSPAGERDVEIETDMPADIAAMNRLVADMRAPIQLPERVRASEGVIS